MTLRCRVLGHDWKDWDDYSYRAYLGHYPNKHCRRCDAIKNVNTGDVTTPR